MSNTAHTQITKKELHNLQNLAEVGAQFLSAIRDGKGQFKFTDENCVVSWWEVRRLKSALEEEKGRSFMLERKDNETSSGVSGGVDSVDNTEEVK